MMLVSYPLLIITLLFLSLYYVSNIVIARAKARRFAAAHSCRPVKQLPQSERILGIGLLWQFRRMEKQHRGLEFISHNFAHGLTLSATMMGKTIINTADPENVKHVLASGFEDFGLNFRERIFSPLLGSGIFDTDGEAWHQSRALLRPAFNKSQVADLNLFETHVRQLLNELPKDGSMVDLGPLFFQLTADVALDYLFGDSDLTPAKKARRIEVCAAFDYAQFQLGEFGNQGPLRHLFWWSKFAKACRLVHEYVDEYVALGLKRADDVSHAVPSEKEILRSDEKPRYVFIDELVKSTRDPIRIRSELLNILLAGRDTTASLLTTAFHVLARHPRVWTKMQHEIETTLAGNFPSYDTLRDMRYLRHFLNECLRLYPIVPANSRTANKDTTLPHGGGEDGKSPIMVHKGQRILYCVWAMHRDKTVFGEDAEEFRPERWETVRPGWWYLPFNGGPRICPGQQFALTEASYTIVRFLQTFSRIENRDEKPWTEKLALTVASRYGAQVALVV